MLSSQPQDEATRLLQDVRPHRHLEPAGRHAARRPISSPVFSSAKAFRSRATNRQPGKAIIYARLKATVSPPAGKAILLMHHMDVVPADRSQWKIDPFSATIQGNELWGRGAMDMKGQGVAQILAFLELKRQRVPLARDVILLAEPDEEVGGALGARWMIAKHYAELDPEYVIDEGGFGSRELFADGKLVYGIAVAEKKIVWLKVRAEGVAGHGSQPTDQNPNDRLVRRCSACSRNPTGPRPPRRARRRSSTS